MAGLDCNLRWIDSRRGIFPPKVPGNVACLESESPPAEVAAMPANAFYLVMTHSHPLDFEICSRILARGDFAYCGLIGSVSKRRRFEKLMRKQGMPDAVLDRLTCPIGIAGIESKKPEAIAIAVAAELLRKQTASTVSHVRPAVNLHVLRQTNR
jgi:xanthine dehydrogenase accessory factor